MLKYSEIEEVYTLQNQRNEDNSLLIRNKVENLTNNENHYHAMIITGIRRCGKSTLMRQIIDNNPNEAFYLNFDTPRLFGFEMKDFIFLDQLIGKSGKKNLFFDEIQSVKGWELYVRQKLDENFRVYVTGSNASLLSQELGTKLTGRHISKELFPFSFNEYWQYLSLVPSAVTFERFMQDGGFPEYLRIKNEEVLISLFGDILYRDIAARQGIRDIRALEQLLLYLAANTGNLLSANRLAKYIDVKSPKTVSEYLSFFEDAYLIAQIPKFSHSLKVQMVNPKKIYFIDNAMAQALSTSFSKNEGRMLENIVFWELRRKFKNIYYFSENNSECDFVLAEKGQVALLLQVCSVLNGENEYREVKGLTTAMGYFSIDTAYIITLNQQDKINTEQGEINVVEVHRFLETL